MQNWARSLGDQAIHYCCYRLENEFCPCRCPPADSVSSQQAQGCSTHRRCLCAPSGENSGSVERSARVEHPWKFSPGKVPQVTSRVRSARTTQHSHNHKLTWKASLLAHHISQNLVNHPKVPPQLFPLSSLPTHIILLFSRHFLHSSPVPCKICLVSTVTRLLSFPICEKVDASFLNFPSSVFQLALNQYSSNVMLFVLYKLHVAYIFQPTYVTR